MFPGLPSIDVASLDELATTIREALDVDGPSVVSIDCSADEIPPFMPFINHRAPKENQPDVVTSA